MKQVKHSSILYSTSKTTQPCPKAFSVNHSIIWQFCCMTDAISSHIAKFFYSSWLWWIVRGILANQKQRNILRPPSTPLDLTWLVLKWIWFIILFWLALLAFFVLLFFILVISLLRYKHAHLKFLLVQCSLLSPSNLLYISEEDEGDFQKPKKLKLKSPKVHLERK